jgi:PGF-CTERM protein
MVLQIEEIDNSGNVVPGSVITISQPVAGSAPVVPSSAAPTHTPPLVTPVPQVTKTPGFAAGAALAALGACILLFRRNT